jgi:fibronectin type 3 domain-containing protein
MATGLIAVVSCDPVDVTLVDAARIELSPASANVAVSDTTRLTARVLSSNNRPVTGHQITWTSLNPTIASVNNGMVTGMSLGTAKIRAAVGEVSDTATVNVINPQMPAIGLSTTSATFAASRNGANPDSQAVAVTNPGAGTLSGLSVAIAYTSGQPTGWLAAILSGTTAPANLRLRATTGTLAVGIYQATVSVSSPVAQNSPQQVEVSFRVSEPAPGAPGNLVATTISTTQINLNWGASSSVAATHYRIERKSGTGAYAVIDSIVPASASTYANTSLTPATLYTYRLQACNASGCSPYSNEASATTFPDAPSNLTARAISTTQIDLSWTAASGTVTRYRIQRKTGVGGTYAVIDSVTTGTTYQNTGLTAATQYYYRVIACNAAGCSTPSSEAFATTGQTPPSVPTALNLTVVSASRIDLSWTGSTGTVDRYRIARKTGAAGTYQPIDSVSGTTYSNTGLAPATQYFYHVQACNAGGCSAFSTEAQATTIPPTPTGFTATAASATQIDLSWTALAGSIDRYEIERSATAGGPFTPIQSVSGTATTYVNGGVTAGTTYYYRIRACSTGGCSGYSQTESATTPVNPPGTPTGLTATAVSSSQINLIWSAPTTGTVTGYRIARRTGSNAFAVIDNVSAGTLTYNNDTGLNPATAYDYQVSACNTGGCSAPATASATTLPNPPGQPSNLVATAVSTTQIDLNWTAATGMVVTYRIERRTGSNQFAAIANVSELTYHDDQRTPGTAYDYRVSACNAGGCSSPSSVESATTPPAAPSNLRANGVLLGISLNWNAPAGNVLEYRIERKTLVTGYSQISTVPGGSTSHTDGSAVLGLLYTYRVRACIAGGVCSAFSNEASASLPIL